MSDNQTLVYKKKKKKFKVLKLALMLEFEDMLNMILLPNSKYSQLLMQFYSLSLHVQL